MTTETAVSATLVVNAQPLIALREDTDKPGWDVHANRFCSGCHTNRSPCLVRIGHAARWRPGDPIYRGAP